VGRTLLSAAFDLDFPVRSLVFLSPQSASNNQKKSNSKATDKSVRPTQHFSYIVLILM
jgi:hypothetical protein